MNSERGIYRHYKGNVYEVLGQAIHTETQEIMIVYKNKHEEIFVRPKSLFTGNVLVDGKMVPRFTKIED